MRVNRWDGLGPEQDFPARTARRSFPALTENRGGLMIKQIIASLNKDLLFILQNREKKKTHKNIRKLRS